MSSYDCVLPIDFDRFVNLLIPQWMRVLSRDAQLNDFVSGFVPHGSASLTEDYGYSSWNLRCPNNYLELFADNNLLTWRTEHIVEIDAYQHWEPEFGHEEVLCAAIKQSCAVELPGDDPLANFIFNGYYNRLHDFPYVQVAGTKTRYRFLSGVYADEWNPSQCLYKFSRLPAMVGAMPPLLESLFLGVRALPGSRLLSEVPAWPASDDLIIQGYLVPHEVVELAEFIQPMQAIAEK